MISPGGSSPLGTIGYVNAAFELKDQVERGLMPQPDKIIIPLGTMGTAVGLTLGLKAAGFKTQVVSVHDADEKYRNKKRFVKLFKKTLALILSMDSSFPLVKITNNEIDIRHDYYGESYARFTEQGMAAIDVLRKSGGIRLEGTYTGKTMAALLDQVRTYDTKNEVIMFWNTHNARDFSHAIKGIDYHQLPRCFHCYFDEDVQPLDT
jgi:D-cysteine desulfhydrase